LALQGIFPAMSRTTSTLLAGAVCTVAGVFPAFAMKLLDFVGIYGTILAPVGAVIVVDHYLARRLGIPSSQENSKLPYFNVAALLAWVIPVGIGFWFYRFQGVAPFFLPLPCWIACGLLYVGLSRFRSRAQRGSS